MKGIAMSTLTSSSSPLTMELQRAVSKIRFFFAKPKAADFPNNVQITKIAFSAPNYPNKELLFPKQSGNDLVNAVNLPSDVTLSSQTWTYGSDAQPLIGNSSIVDVPSPLAHVRATTQTPGEYITYLETNCQNLAFDGALTYMRESGNTITCTIYYTIFDGTTTTVKKNGTVSFNINNNVADGPFPRNYYAAVYGYFIDNSLFVRPVVMPWIWGGEYAYKTKTSAQLTVDNTYNVFNYLLYSHQGASNEDYYDDGEERAKRFDHCAISYGYTPEGRPLYGPWLKLVTTSGNTLKLQTNNPNYGFVLYDKSSATYSSSVLDVVEIPVSKNRETNFYVVPKTLLAFEEREDAIRFVEVVLIEDMGEAGLQRLPYNHSIPRHESGETARFYYVRPGDYADKKTETGASLTVK